MADAAEAGGHGAESAGGLPQFDPTYFPSQLFWLALFFVLLYLLLDRILLPRVGGVIEARADAIRSDIDAAAAANEDAQAALKGYDDAIATARAEARAAMDAARAEAGDMRARQTTEAESVFLKRLEEAEARLAERRRDGLKAAREAADEVAHAVVAKITGRA